MSERDFIDRLKTDPKNVAAQLTALTQISDWARVTHRDNFDGYLVAAAELLTRPQSPSASNPVADEQIKYMADRFLAWKLPEHFHPDAGISFDPVFNKGTPYEMRHLPTGTNLFDADQAEAMVRYMVEGLSASNPVEDDLVEELRTGKCKCPSLAPTLSERPLSSAEWREVGVKAAEALSALQADVERLRDLPRLIELQRTAAPEHDRDDGWNAGLERAAALVSAALRQEEQATDNRASNSPGAAGEESGRAPLPTNEGGEA